MEIMKNTQTHIQHHIKKVKPLKNASTSTTGIACIPSGGPDSAAS
jgi:hypothetical protein